MSGWLRFQGFLSLVLQLADFLIGLHQLEFLIRPYPLNGVTLPEISQERGFLYHLNGQGRNICVVQFGSLVAVQVTFFTPLLSEGRIHGRQGSTNHGCFFREKTIPLPRFTLQHLFRHFEAVDTEGNLTLKLRQVNRAKVGQKKVDCLSEAFRLDHNRISFLVNFYAMRQFTFDGGHFHTCISALDTILKDDLCHVIRFFTFARIRSTWNIFNVKRKRADEKMPKHERHTNISKTLGRDTCPRHRLIFIPSNTTKVRFQPVKNTTLFWLTRFSKMAGLAGSLSYTPQFWKNFNIYIYTVSFLFIGKVWK